MRKILLLIPLLAVLILAACSGEGKEKEEKQSKANKTSKMFEASIEEANFILTTKDGEFDPEGQSGTIKIDINIKNTTDQSIDILPLTDVQLYHDDLQIDPKSDMDSTLDLNLSLSTSIAAGKQKVYTVLFEVERDQTYELAIEPQIYMTEEKPEPVIIPVDMSEYADTYATLNEPKEVLEAYIRTIYFNDPNEQLAELMDVNVEEEMEKAKSDFAHFLKNVTNEESGAKQVDQFYKVLQETLNQNGEIDIKLKGNSGEKALVEITYKGVSAMNVGDEYRKVRQSYMEKTNSYNREEADEYALSKLDLLIQKSKVIEGRRALDAYMIKNDGKWTFENKYDDTAEKLNNIFARGSIY